jgi:hypothetical protein
VLPPAPASVERLVFPERELPPALLPPALLPLL